MIKILTQGQLACFLLQPYSRKSSNLYAVRGDRRVLIRYIEPQDGTLLLRPQSQQFPLILIETSNDGSVTDDHHWPRLPCQS